jgi:hypothetical protein
MNTWTPLWSGIVNSSLWAEPDSVVKIFLTMLALKDYDNVCRLDVYGIADRSKKSQEEVLEALRILSSPDTRRITPQPFEGRRVEAVADGWLILNGEKYRDQVSEEMRKARNRRAMANWRAKKAGKPLPYQTGRIHRAYEQKVIKASGECWEEAKAMGQGTKDVGP